jgi:adenine-specific DNA-methyltransferase
MALKKSNSKPPKQVETLIHEDARRTNIPSAEHQSVVGDDISKPIKVAYERRNRDLDPQLVWRGKDEQDLSDLVVNAPPLYIQERVHPKVIIDDLRKKSNEQHRESDEQIDLFADFNGVDEDAQKTDFYQHESNWTNRMILGDSLQVMASLSEREGLRGKVQCIYFDPPYGIKFNSNFQWSTTNRDVKDGKQEHITREPEMVKAFRDTWRDGIHTYLTYLRERLIVARDLLSDSGSIFLQIGDENVHRVRALMDEVFGEDNFCALIAVSKSGGGLGTSSRIATRFDYLVWFTKDAARSKYVQLFDEHDNPEEAGFTLVEIEKGRIVTKASLAESVPFNAKQCLSQVLTKPGPGSKYDVEFQGKVYTPGKRWWGMPPASMDRIIKAGRIIGSKSTIRFCRYLSDFPYKTQSNLWDGIGGATDKTYVVQTSPEIIKRCILMTTSPGDLVLDPTCGSGSTATVAEKWGRRWITIDTSRVALALARARLMGSRYPYFLLADSREGQIKEAKISGEIVSKSLPSGNIKQGFVNARAPRITSSVIGNNHEIDVIWDRYQEILQPIRSELNDSVNMNWEDWEIPKVVEECWSDKAKNLHAQWWENLDKRQQEIDSSIAAKADFVYLHDKPYEDRQCVRVSGPFTVESISPHRFLDVDEYDELIDRSSGMQSMEGDDQSFTQMILENLKTAGVQQSHKEDRINFTSISLWAGAGLVCAEGLYQEGDMEKRAGIFIGPEFGTVQRSDLVAAARECGDAGFDALIACAFNYEAHATEFSKLGRIPVLKARMNADLHMADDLKNTGKGNLFVIFGEPDIDVLDSEDGQIQVKINGVDVFHPQTGEVRSDGADGIACWFIDTDYNEEAFFVRQAYFLGANDPYKSLKTSLKSEIDEDAWASLNSDTSRVFSKPTSGRIAVKVINHLGDEVMKVFRVD